jgi:hypothetical protein
MSFDIVRSLMNKSERFKGFVRNYRTLRASYMNNSKHLPEGIDRIYHIHIRKSAGSSLNNLFFNQAALSLKEFWREPLYIKNGKVFVQHQKPHINKGDYYYASSHWPIWDLHLPPNTFTYCILRDPVDRLISLYKYYCWVAQVDEKTGYSKDPSYYSLLQQKSLLNKAFKEFVNNLSNKYLFNQLYMFDQNLNPNKALELLSKVDKVYFFDDIQFAIEDLVSSLNLKPLTPSKERSFQNVSYSVTEEDKEFAKEKLALEIEFYQKARQIYYHTK